MEIIDPTTRTLGLSKRFSKYSIGESAPIISDILLIRLPKTDRLMMDPPASPIAYQIAYQPYLKAIAGAPINMNPLIAVVCIVIAVTAGPRERPPSKYCSVEDADFLENHKPIVNRTPR